jgi:hypothetical protein
VDQAQCARLRNRKHPQTIPGHARVHVLGGGLLRCGVCALQGRSSALHVSKSRKDEDSAYYACYGRFQGQPCTQSAVADHVLEAQLTGFFDAFVLPDDFQTRILDLYQHEHAATSNGGLNNPAARRSQLEARLERQRHLYELGDWTRERYLAARNETLSELAELDMSHPTNPAEDPEAITRLGAYVRELRTAWRDADKAQRRLLVRTLFEQIWVMGDRLFAAKPVGQFAPFFRLVRNLQGDDVEQRVYLAPTFSLQDEDADTVEEVGALSKKMAQDLEDTGRLSRHLRQVQTGGPDGVPIRERDTLPSTGSDQTVPGFSSYFPLQLSQPPRGQSTYRQRHRLLPDLWPEIQKRAKHESLRHLAVEYGVSHEAIWRIVNMKRIRRADRRRSA